MALFGWSLVVEIFVVLEATLQEKIDYFIDTAETNTTHFMWIVHRRMVFN